MKKIIYISLSIVVVATISIISILLYCNFPYDQKNLIINKQIFKTEKEYNKFITDNVSFTDFSINLIKIEHGDNFWKIAKHNQTNIDSLIAANPYWKNLLAHLNQEIIVPQQKGCLYLINNKKDISKLAKIYNISEKEIVLQDLPHFFFFKNAFKKEKNYFAVFIKNKKPTLTGMTDELAKQYALRERFRSPLGGRFSSFFGARNHPIFHKKRFHNGVDIAARRGTYVGAACAGIVTFANWNGGYGKCIIIRHSDGFKTLYGHLSSINVHIGQKIKQGQFIGRVGSTGRSTGPHLHFTIWHKNKLLNPMDVLW